MSKMAAVRMGEYIHVIGGADGDSNRLNTHIRVRISDILVGSGTRLSEATEAKSDIDASQVWLWQIDDCMFWCALCVVRCVGPN